MDMGHLIMGPNALGTAHNTLVVNDNGTVTMAGSNATVSWTVSSGTAISASNVNLGGNPLLALVIPTGYASGDITFQACDTASGSFVDVYDSDGVIVTATVAGADRVVAMTGTTMQALSALQFVKLKTASAVDANRVIVAITKG